MFKSFPKPEPRVSSKAKAIREDRRKALEFRREVWERDEGRCRYCTVTVMKTLSVHPRRGEVHHLRGRRVAPQDLYNPDKAVLLCMRCHSRAQRHEIEIIAPLFKEVFDGE